MLWPVSLLWKSANWISTILAAGLNPLTFAAQINAMPLMLPSALPEMSRFYIDGRKKNFERGR